MTKLAALKSQLTTLKQTRQSVRLATAFAALAIAVLWALAGVFVFDVLFELPVLPRLIVMVIAAASCFWAYTKYTQPMLGVTENELDMALMVERQQKIDSDLVAAIQFESPSASSWGSRQLETAVIDYVAEFGNGLNVFEGFSREQMTRRGTILGLSLAVAAAFALLAPSYASVFLDRLLLGAQHYPSRTVIERIVVNNSVVLDKATHGSSPIVAKAAQGQPMLFYVHCSGVLPDAGVLRVRAIAGGSSRPIEMKPLTNDQRVSLLRSAQSKFAAAIAQEEVDTGPAWQQELGALLSFDAPAIAAQLPKLSDDRAPLAGLQTELDKIIDGWPGNAKESKVYLGDMGRLVDDISYSLKVGDAWTDPARVRMIPLPAVELLPTIVPPKYARNEKVDALTSQRQISVLEGSEVQLALSSVNEKPLKEAYLIAKTRDDVKKLPFAKTDDTGLKWSLPAANSPFKNITEEIRYEIQVTDVDDLHLDAPIRGVIRLRPDRAPSGSAEVVHRVVLPTANPVIGYRLNDDYGISQVLLKVEIERSHDSAGTPPPGFDPAFDAAPAAQNEQDKTVLFTLHSKDQPFLPTTEPIRGAYELHLSPLMLAKGDRLKLTLDITDYRGAAAGQTYLSDPLILEISDESGVLAAISEADERSEQRLTDIIKKQLGIGESP